MGHLGYGYGSEFQLLRFMGRHRNLLDDEIKKQINIVGNIKWLDFEFTDLRNSLIGDKELTGLQFLNLLSFVSNEQIQSIRNEISQFKVGIMISKQSWDAIFTIADSLYLVEAKAYCEEMNTKDHERSANDNIKSFMQAQLPNVNVSCEWLRQPYQLANRLATAALLNRNGVKTKILYLFFENGYNKRQIIDKEIVIIENKDTQKSDFEDALNREMTLLGISRDTIKNLFVTPVYINANPILL